MSERMVPPDVILMGAWYALEQAGRLLVASEAIARRGDRTTATSVALLAREEFGKARIFIDLSREGGSRGVPPSTLKLSGHVHKQRAANTSTVVTTRSEELARPFGGEAWRKFWNVIVRKQARRTPDRRDELREQCIYVDFDEDRWAWSRPHDIRTEEVDQEFRQAFTDYNTFVRNLTLAINEPEHRASIGGQYAMLAGFADGWLDRPHLPIPGSPDDL